MTIRDVVNLLVSYTFTEEEIKTLLANKELSNNYDLLYNHIKEDTDFFISIGLSLQEIRIIIMLSPGYYKLSLINLQDTALSLTNLGYQKEDIVTMLKKNSTLLQNNKDKITNSIDKITKIGYIKDEKIVSFEYTRKEALRILYLFPAIIPSDEKTLSEKITAVMALGYDEKETRSIIYKWPYILSRNIENYNNKKKLFIDYGFTIPQTLKIFKENGSILSRGENILEKIAKILSDLGYSKKSIIRILSSTPSLLALDKENIDKKFNNLINMGYSKEQVIEMTTMHTALLSYSTTRVNNRLQELEQLNFPKEQILNSLHSFPGLFGFASDTLKEKLLYLRSIGLDTVFINDPKDLMQGVDLTYARYQFLTERGLKLTSDNCYLLFQENKYYVKRFGVSKEDLISRYSYQEYKERQNESINGPGSK